MDNSENITYHKLNNKMKLNFSQNYGSIRNIPIMKKKVFNIKMNEDKKIIKRKLVIPNAKCHFKKSDGSISKQKEKKEEKQPISNKYSKIITKPLKRKSSGYIRRNNNINLYNSKSGENIQIKKIENLKNEKGIKIIKYYRNSVKENKENKPINTKIISIKSGGNLPKNYNNIGIKIIPSNQKYNERPLYITKIEERSNILNNNINNHNYNGHITYNNNVNLNFNNNKGNEIIFDIPKKIYIFNSPKIAKEINPVKIKNIKKKYNNKIENKRNKIPINLADISKIKKEFPNNYSYHEIIHFNSPKKLNKNNYMNKSVQYKNMNEEKDYNKIGKINPSYEDIFYENNNLKKIPDNNLIHNQSFSHLHYKQPIIDNQPLYYSTIFTDKNNIKKEYYNNICLNPKKMNKNGFINGLIISPKKQKLEISDQYAEIENDDTNQKQQTIHFFGEQMLERNKNYNFSKNIYNDNFIPKCGGIKISLKHHHSHSNINQDKLAQEFGNNISLNNNIKNNISNSGNKLKKTNRYSHNIINRKKIRKLVMEKSLNEEFISKSNKKEKNNKNTKRIKCFENSLIDNESLNEIIKEFEKENEEEEKKENLNKKLNISNNDSLKFSFLSDNEYSIVSRDSANNSKIKKLHYYKTKKMDMEKNYDFIIYGKKKKNSLKK